MLAGLLIVATPWVASVLAGSSPPVVAARADARPNLLVLVTDQQHAGVMSNAGDRFVKTPALDGLAAAGTRFDRAYVTNPVCVPSRISMITGHMPSAFGVKTNGDVRQPIPPSVLEHAVGAAFRRDGYDAVFGGKVHWFRGLTPEAMGFRDLGRDERDGLVRDAASFIAEKHERPFLLFVSLINPHDICYQAIDAFTDATGASKRYPESKVERSELARAMAWPAALTRAQFFATLAPPLPQNFAIPVDEPEAITSELISDFTRHVRGNWSDEDWRLHRFAYRRLTERVDGQIDLVLRALHDSGHDRDTVVLFTSDHGDMDGAHRLEHKSTFYDEASRVPFVVRDPQARGRAGRTDADHLISVGLDLLPTLYDYAGIAVPEPLLGKSVKSLLRSRGTEHWRDDLVVESGSGRMLRTRDFKYSVFPSGSPREQLIDMRADPGEMKNVAATAGSARNLRRHRARLQRWMTETHDPGASGLVPGSRP